MYICQWPIFHGPVIFASYLKTIWWTNATIGILVPCDAKIYLIKCMWVSDLHFMVQWFCLISWRLFDGLILYWRYECDTYIDLELYCRSVTYISWSSDFALYLEDYLMDKCHNWNIGSMWLKNLPHEMYAGQYLHFMVQWLCHILKITLINAVLEIFSVTRTLNWNHICRSVTYISWSSDLSFYLRLFDGQMS